MVLFVSSIIAFNAIAYKINKKLTMNQVVHIWTFSMVLEMMFDIFIDEKKHGYSYFWNGIDWTNILVYLLLIPPVNIVFLNLFPFGSSLLKRIGFMSLFVAVIVGYEALTLVPEPWGYFHYGWWHLYYSLILDPILLSILILYYKWICKIEKSI
jgi:hypothetical protein